MVVTSVEVPVSSKIFKNELFNVYNISINIKYISSTKLSNQNLLYHLLLNKQYYHCKGRFDDVITIFSSFLLGLPLVSFTEYSPPPSSLTEHYVINFSWNILIRKLYLILEGLYQLNIWSSNFSSSKINWSTIKICQFPN